jgi:hypothetical protein
MEYYSAMKKNEITPSEGKWMELYIIMLNKIMQVQQDKYHIFYSYAQSRPDSNNNNNNNSNKGVLCKLEPVRGGE